MGFSPQAGSEAGRTLSFWPTLTPQPRLTSGLTLKLGKHKSSIEADAQCHNCSGPTNTSHRHVLARQGSRTRPVPVSPHPLQQLLPPGHFTVLLSLGTMDSKRMCPLPLKDQDNLKPSASLPPFYSGWSPHPSLEVSPFRKEQGS